jgi:hypothetical protein
VKRSKILVGLTSAVAAGAMTIHPAGAAQAAPTSTCTVASFGPLCIYWGQSYNDSHSGVVEAVSNFPVSGSTSYKYLSAGTGQGQFIGNNNGSVINDDTTCTAFLWYSTGSSGPELTLSRHGTTGDEKAGSAQGTLLNNLRSLSWAC